MNIHYPLPQTIVTDLAELDPNHPGPIASWNIIGTGLSGIVLQHATHSHILVKRFKDIEDWGADEHNYDYVALQHLQGISAFPLLYGYIPDEIMIMSQAKGYSIFQLIVDHKFGEKEFSIVNSSLKTIVCRCIERGWVPKDLRTRHVYWDQENETVSLIDFGMYQPLSEYKLQHDSVSDPEVVSDVLEEFREHVIVTAAHHERKQKTAVSF